MFSNVSDVYLKHLPTQSRDEKEIIAELRSLEPVTLYNFVSRVMKDINLQKKDISPLSFYRLGVLLEKTEVPELVFLMKITKYEMSPSSFNEFIEPIIKIGNVSKARIPCEEFMRRHHLLLTNNQENVSYVLSERLERVLDAQVEALKEKNKQIPYEKIEFHGERERNQVTLAMKDEFLNICQMEKLFIGDGSAKEIFTTAAHKTKVDVCYSTSPFGVLDFHFGLKGLTVSNLYRDVFREFVSERGGISQREIIKKVMTAYDIEYFEYDGKEYYCRLYIL